MTCYIVDSMAPEYTELDHMGMSRSSRYGARVTNFLLHTQEGNGSAQSLAAYLNNTSNGVSYHYTIDNAVTVVDVVDTDYASWSVLDANSFTINLCFAGSFAHWSEHEWLANMGDAIDVAAYFAVRDAQKYGFATDVITHPYHEAEGISDHRYVTDCLGIGTHTDVGPGFPWSVFRAAVKKYTNGEDTMPTPADYAAAVWAHRMSKPNGTDTETAGNLITWTDKHAAETVAQLAGQGAEDQRDELLTPVGSAVMARLDRIEAQLNALIEGKNG